MSDNLKKGLEEIGQWVEDIERDLSKDRTKLDTIEIKIDTLTSMIQQLYDRLPRTEEKIKNAVADGLAETVQPVSEMVDRLKKITKTVIQPLEKKSLWQKLFRRGGVKK